MIGIFEKSPGAKQALIHHPSRRYTRHVARRMRVALTLSSCDGTHSPVSRARWPDGGCFRPHDGAMRWCVLRRKNPHTHTCARNRRQSWTRTLWGWSRKRICFWRLRLWVSHGLTGQTGTRAEIWTPPIHYIFSGKPKEKVLSIFLNFGTNLYFLPKQQNRLFGLLLLTILDILPLWVVSLSGFLFFFYIYFDCIFNKSQ